MATPEQQQRANAYFITTTVVTGIGMVGIGAALNRKTLLLFLKNPKAFIFGVSLQVLLMPLLAWAFTKAVLMPIDEAFGVFILGCSPGGVISNLAVFWLGGILELSVALTITTTLLAMGFIPLWLRIYTLGEERTANLLIPYDNLGYDRLGIILAVFLVTLIIGMLVRVYMEKCAWLITKITVTFASIAVVVIMIVGSILSTVPWKVSWKQPTIAPLLPSAAFGIAHLVTLIPWLKISRIRNTIAIGTFMQNIHVALVASQRIAGTDNEFFAYMAVFPLIYNIFQIGYAIFFILLYTLAEKKGWIHPYEEDIERNLTGVAHVEPIGDTVEPDFDETELKEKETVNSAEIDKEDNVKQNDNPVSL